MNELEYNNSDPTKPTFQMDKIREELADLLPTEKVCPECGGSGTIFKKFDSINAEILCPICKGSSTISLYYTPEQYEKIMGKPYPDDAPIWFTRNNEQLELGILKDLNKYYDDFIIYIVQTGQPAPVADYRPEE